MVHIKGLNLMVHKFSINRAAAENKMARLAFPFKNQLHKYRLGLFVLVEVHVKKFCKATA